MTERRFTDDEVRDVLRRAVQEAPGTALVSGEGLTRTELEAIGAEVGIDAAQIERAVWSMDHDHTRGGAGLLGGPRVVNVQRKVRGELPEGARHEVLATVRRHMGRSGDAAEVAGAIEWSATGEAGEHHVSVSSRDGFTTVTGSANLSSAAVMGYLPATTLATVGTIIGFAVSANDANQVGMILSLALVPTALGLVRTLFGRFARGQARALQAAVDEVAGLVEETGEATPP